MNSFAAKELKIPFKHIHPAHTVVVWRNKNKRLRVQTIRHEEIEALLMKRRHYSYPHAHSIALKLEKKKGRLKQNEL